MSSETILFFLLLLSEEQNRGVTICRVNELLSSQLSASCCPGNCNSALHINASTVIGRNWQLGTLHPGTGTGTGNPTEVLMSIPTSMSLCTELQRHLLCLNISPHCHLYCLLVRHASTPTLELFPLNLPIGCSSG